MHRIKGEEEPETESMRYAQEIKDHMALRNRQDTFFDWALLGPGIDGHTASLFPGQEKTLNTSNLCEGTWHSGTNQTRITLTPVIIRRSTCTTHHVLGEQKADIVSALVLKPEQNKNYPATNISGEWYLDKAAAYGLIQS